MDIKELKIKAYDTRQQIDLLDNHKAKLITEYNNIVAEISKIESCKDATKKS